MDTRRKILTPEASCHIPRDSRRLIVVTGYFDVLLPAPIRDLRQLRQASPNDILSAMVLPLENAVLTCSARTELAASLAMIDYVVNAETVNLDELLERIGPDAVVRREAEHLRYTRQLIEHVHRRHAK